MIIVTFVLQFPKALVEKKITVATAVEKSHHLFIHLIPLSNIELWCKGRFVLKGSCACFPVLQDLTWDLSQRRMDLAAV